MSCFPCPLALPSEVVQALLEVLKFWEKFRVGALFLLFSSLPFLPSQPAVVQETVVMPFFKKKPTELSDLRVLLSVCFHSANRLFLPELSCELFQGLAEMVAVSVNKTLHVMSDVVTEM